MSDINPLVLLAACSPWHYLAAQHVAAGLTLCTLVRNQMATLRPQMCKQGCAHTVTGRAGCAQQRT